MTKLMSTPYLVLMIVLGSITITTVLAQTITISPAPYIITNGTNNRLVIANNGNVGIGGTTTSPPSLLYVRQLTDTNLSGMIFQNSAATGSLRFWIDSSNNGYINNAGVSRIAILATGNTNFPVGNVGIGTATPSQKLDVAGNVALTGNMTATPANQFKITTSNGKDICIGSC